jgi:hypothetical protein
MFNARALGVTIPLRPNRRENEGFPAALSRIRITGRKRAKSNAAERSDSIQPCSSHFLIPKINDSNCSIS